MPLTGAEWLRSFGSQSDIGAPDVVAVAVADLFCSPSTLPAPLTASKLRAAMHYFLTQCRPMHGVQTEHSRRVSKVLLDQKYHPFVLPNTQPRSLCSVLPETDSLPLSPNLWAETLIGQKKFKALPKGRSADGSFIYLLYRPLVSLHCSLFDILYTTDTLVLLPFCFFNFLITLRGFDLPFCLCCSLLIQTL